MEQEQIGNVILDLTHYSGSDQYCDGEVEDRILEIVRDVPENEFDRVIRRERSWPILYHLSSIRGNIVNWIPFTGREKVLEIGAGPGAVTGVLTQRCAQVDCIELSRKRSMINAWRHRECGNLTIHVGNFEDIEPGLGRDYDYVFLIGVLEYAESYLKSADPFREELTRVFSHLAPEGRAVIAIENRLGLKYWAGCAEDHSGRYFDGIESYAKDGAPAKTFSRPALEQLLARSGAEAYSFYYPFPDYKFMSVLYSDRRLPQAAELSDNIRNFDRDRLLLFDEQKAYRGISQDGLYPLFSNSYEIVTGPPLPVTYCKFSNDRAPRYRIRTQINVPPDTGTGGEGRTEPERSGAAGEHRGGTPEVRKYPLTPEAAAHVDRMEESGHLLSRRYMRPVSGMADFSHYRPGLRIAPCRRTKDGGVSFPFVEGRSLESLLDECLEKGDGERFLRLLDAYRERVGAGSDHPVSDYDMTFSNILVQGELWTAVDYEWAVEESIPAGELLFRSLLVYYMEDPSRSRRCEELIGGEVLLERIGIPEEEANRLAMEEQNFQNQVTEGVTPLGELRSQMGTGVIKPAQLQTPEEIQAAVREREKEARSLSSVQIYYDTGEGYREETSFWIDQNYGEEGMLTFTLDVPDGVQRLRVDPAICPCVVMIRGVRAGEEEITAKAGRMVRTNGRQYSGGSIVYTTSDPWMEWKLRNLRRVAGLEPSGVLPLELTIQMAGLPSTMAEEMERRR